LAKKKSYTVQEENLLLSIAYNTACQTEGVASLAKEPRLLFKNHKKKYSGIKLLISGEYVAADVTIAAYYGSKIPEVAFSIQKRIKTEIEGSTRFKIRTVNVNVIGVIFTS